MNAAFPSSPGFSAHGQCIHQGYVDPKQANLMKQVQ
jgi:hypothetical protein